MPGAINVAHTRLAARLAEVPKDRHLLVNCRTGKRSARASSFLQRLGYEVTNLEGGILAWDQAHATTER
jgi:hydroxyacylglutathione hydrolase